MWRFLYICLIGNIILLAACGGSSSSSSSSSGNSSGNSSSGNGTTGQPNNVQSVIVDAGPPGVNAVNSAYTTVTVCVPGSTTQCQTVDHVLIDTGSSGLRLLSSVLTITLPNQSSANGNTLAECTVFADGYAWGPVAHADLKMAGETASSVPVQIVVPTSSGPAVPSSCSSQTTGPNEGSGPVALGANGVLGVGIFQQDCGQACSPGFMVQDVYYDCPASGCAPVSVAVTQQVANPVIFFASDHNGLMLQLPSVPAAGAASVSGSLIFGIGTQSNNALGGATVFTANTTGNNVGDFTTVFAGNTYPASYIDSGSNGLFFPSTGTNLTPCAVNKHFYCTPGSSSTNPAPENLSAINTGANGTSGSVSFTVEAADALFNSTNNAFNDLSGPVASSPSFPAGFDWGLPFFFGRNVFVAIEGESTPAGTGPYWAY
jgi:hypothetical protein